MKKQVTHTDRMNVALEERRADMPKEIMAQIKRNTSKLDWSLNVCETKIRLPANKRDQVIPKNSFITLFTFSGFFSLRTKRITGITAIIKYAATALTGRPIADQL